MHEVRVAGENLPALHAVQELPPVLAPVFVIDPAPQSIHAATLEIVEYLPAAHAVHVFAPAAAAISVIDPG